MLTGLELGMGRKIAPVMNRTKKCIQCEPPLPAPGNEQDHCIVHTQKLEVTRSKDTLAYNDSVPTNSCKLLK